MKGKLVSTVLTNDTVLDFEVLSGGRGIRHLSISNVGTSTLVIDDATQEEILPGESFFLESDIALINDDFSLRFARKTTQHNKVFVRYVVEIQNC